MATHSRSQVDAEVEAIMARQNRPTETEVPGTEEANQRMIREAEEEAGLSKFRQSQLIINALSDLPESDEEPEVQL